MIRPRSSGGFRPPPQKDKAQAGRGRQQQQNRRPQNNPRPQYEGYGFVEPGTFAPIRGSQTNPDQASLHLKDEEEKAVGSMSSSNNAGKQSKAPVNLEQVRSVIEETLDASLKHDADSQEDGEETKQSAR